MPIEVRIYAQEKVTLVSFVGRVSDAEFLELMSLDQHPIVIPTPHIIIDTTHNTSVPSLAVLTKIKPTTLKGWLFFVNTRQHNKLGSFMAATVARILNLNFRIVHSYEEINHILYRVDLSIQAGTLPNKINDLPYAMTILHKQKTEEFQSL
ncbi:MAG: hypothetical protein ACOYLB_09610 [Phototrophicaceae bacterium]